MQGVAHTSISDKAARKNVAARIRDGIMKGIELRDGCLYPKTEPEKAKDPRCSGCGAACVVETAQCDRCCIMPMDGDR